MPTFFYPWLAVAGAAAAAVPVIVHLLNRRRFRVVPWAAMDFLRQAVARSRRMVELRDLLLLALRVLCLLIFALALGRPYWSRSTQTAVDPSDDCTIWYVGDYYKRDATSYSTKIGGFRMPGCQGGAGDRRQE